MSNEETGKLIDLIKSVLPPPSCEKHGCKECRETIASGIVGAIESKYRIEPLENTVEEEKS